MATKRQRQHLITELLSGYDVTSQGQLVELLDDAGIEATQATVSRDLEELGAVKVRAASGETVYAVSTTPAAPPLAEGGLRRVVTEWVVSVVSSKNIVVLRTPPGSAHVVASALDRANMKDVAGTVAGDDTVMVVASEQASGRKLAVELRRLAGLT